MYRLTFFFFAIAILVSCVSNPETSGVTLREKSQRELGNWLHAAIRMTTPDFLNRKFNTKYASVIAFVDTGFQSSASTDALGGRVIVVGNTLSNTLQSKQIVPFSPHGTGMVSVALGIANGSGNLGTCFLVNCRGIMYQALDIDGLSTEDFESVAVALTEACSRSEVRVVNLSMVFAKPLNDIITEAFDVCIANRKLVVASSGNGFWHGPNVSYACKREEIVCVGGMSTFYEPVKYYPVDETIDIFAPAVQVPILVENRYAVVYGLSEGTSISAALVSGAAALYLTQYPYTTVDEIRVMLSERQWRPEGWPPHLAGVLDMSTLLQD